MEHSESINEKLLKLVIEVVLWIIEASRESIRTLRIHTLCGEFGKRKKI